MHAEPRQDRLREQVEQKRNDYPHLAADEGLEDRAIPPANREEHQGHVADDLDLEAPEP